MKKSLIIIALLPLLAAAQQQPSLYFSTDDMPNAAIFLPAPPDSNSHAFVYDITQYMWGKTQRQSERGRMAVSQATISIAEMARQFSQAFGMDISPKGTPAIFRVLERGIPTLRLGATRPKDAYMRRRPYCQFNEPTSLPNEEEELRNTGSYPSGHTVRGWGMALLLSEINPDAQDALLKLGYEWGQSRVIAGYHWQSDVDAGRLLASACYARLHSSKEFLSDMAKARKEYTRLRRQQKK